jgi:hypothetical protein
MGQGPDYNEVSLPAVLKGRFCNRRVDAAYPQFDPLIYSLENDLPLVKFGLDDRWAPDETYKPKDPVVSYDTLRWARVLLILCGWLQATVLAAAIGSRFKA